jgi:hypothetical protein
MKLRSGKITNSRKLSKCEALIAQFKTLFKQFDETGNDEFLERVQVCADVFNLILDNLETIGTPEFQPSTNFIETVYKRSTHLEMDLPKAFMNYLEKNQSADITTLREKSDELSTLLRTTRDEIKTRYSHRGVTLAYCGCEDCLDD